MIAYMLDSVSKFDKSRSSHAEHQWVLIGCIHDQSLAVDSFYTISDNE